MELELILANKNKNLLKFSGMLPRELTVHMEQNTRRN